MSTFFDEQKRSFVDVPIVDGKISTSEFLEASESLIKLFGKGSCITHILNLFKSTNFFK